MGGYDEYGLSAPKCLLGADGKPLEEQPRNTGEPEQGCVTAHSINGLGYSSRAAMQYWCAAAAALLGLWN